MGIGGGRVRLRLLGSRRGPGRGRGRTGGSATRGGGSGTALLARHFCEVCGVRERLTKYVDLRSGRKEEEVDKYVWSGDFGRS